MEITTHVVDGFTWESVTVNDEGHDVYSIVGVPESYPVPDGAWDLAFADITEVNEAYLASVGLAGRSGGEEFSELFVHFEAAARYCIQMLEEHFFSEDGKFHDVDAIR